MHGNVKLHETHINKNKLKNIPRGCRCVFAFHLQCPIDGRHPIPELNYEFRRWIEFGATKLIELFRLPNTCREANTRHRHLNTPILSYTFQLHIYDSCFITLTLLKYITASDRNINTESAYARRLNTMRIWNLIDFSSRSSFQFHLKSAINIFTSIVNTRRWKADWKSNSSH